MKNLLVKITKCIMISVVLLNLCACSDITGKGTDIDVQSNTGFIVTKAGMYDSSDEMTILVKKNPEEKTVTFYNSIIGREYTLNYDGTSKICDKYGTAMSMEQINPGCIVDITFLKSKKLLNSMAISNEAWNYSDIKDFSIDEKKASMIINGENYKLDDSLYIYLGSEKAELMDINPVDALNISGIDKRIKSIVINKGHGYLRLKNQDKFLDGWLEVGDGIIKKIEDNMLIAVPVGKYEVRLSGTGIESKEVVSIVQNKETELDLSSVEIEETISYGNLIIVTDPANAKVFIDGEEVDTSKAIKLKYGIHQIIVKAEGYESLTQYIKVGQENATLELNLDESVKEAEVTPSASPSPSSSESPTVTITPTATPVPTASVTKAGEQVYNTVSGNTLTTTVNGRKITINTPTGAEVYVDGVYTGIAPINFAKTSGNHEITLRKGGYITRSYTISIDNSDRDETFSFSDLEKE